jgi:DNA (cytosine-5)-methyltransferase 1
MQIIDLFSGIGGFSLAGRWAGWETIQFCEIDKFCQKVLSYHFPGVPIHDDIKTLNYEQVKERIDPSRPTILTGGFPCQPYSSAGKRLGKEDDRHLWPYMLRAIQQIQPTWVVGENVRGLTNWNGGLVFDEVQADLEAEGYEVTPFVLPACAVNAPHRRDRVWFVANSNNSGTRKPLRDNRDGKEKDEGRQGQSQHEYRTDGRDGDAADTAICGLERIRDDRLCEPEKFTKFKRFGTKRITPDPDNRSRSSNTIQTGWKITEMPSWTNFPTTEPTIRSGNDGIPRRLDGITFPKWRNESIKAYGNAIVPQVVYQIFKAINLCP